jgi:hypothetical protein
MNISSHSESFVPVLLLWFLGAGTFIFYSRNKKHWSLLVLAFVFLMGGFTGFNDSLIRIFPDHWMALFWLLGFSAVFFAIWYLSRHQKPLKWSYWLGVIFAINSCFIFFINIAKLEADVLGPSILIIIGIWLIYTKAIRQGKSTRKS